MEHLTVKSAEDLLVQALLPHRRTLEKLMRLRRCHTRAQVKDLAISPQQLRDLLHCGSGHPITHAGSSTVFRLSDRHLAATLHLTPKRWAYLKQLILHPPPPSVRAQHQELRERWV